MLGKVEAWLILHGREIGEGGGLGRGSACVPQSRVMEEGTGLVSGIPSACTPWKRVRLEDAYSRGSAVFCVGQIAGHWLWASAENAFMNKEAKSLTCFDL